MRIAQGSIHSRSSGGRKFRILYRDFLFRIVDLEILSAHGDLPKLVGQFAAILAAFSFVLAFLFVPRYAFSRLPHEKLATAAWGDEEFLIATTIAVVGLFAVVAWNTILPDRRDVLVLGPLPVRARTVFIAKLCAMITALTLSVAAVNLFTGLTFPFLIGGSASGGLRSFAAYWLTMLGAGGFVFAALFVLQGAVAQMLPYHLFLRVSSILQLGSFALILGVFLLTPPLASLHGLSAPENQGLLLWLPSFWFLGLFQILNGASQVIFVPLAREAIRNLLIAASLALLVYGSAYYRQTRKIIEQPDIAPGAHWNLSRIGNLLAAGLFSGQLDRAILLFTARTIARSRQHRFLLAAYGGAGLAIALAYTKSLVYGYSREHWDQVNSAFLAASFALLIFIVTGSRAIFALPLELRANWVFRITAVQRPAAYFDAVRKTLYVLTLIPVCVSAALIFLAIWPGRPALEHTIVLTLAGIVIIERSLYQFQKIPFACSYLPGSANVNVKLGIYAIVFLLAAEIGSQIEFWAMQKTARFFAICIILIASAAWSRRRTSTAMPLYQIQFAELPPSEIQGLDLASQGVWLGQEGYVDTVPPKLYFRTQTAAVTLLLLLTCGLAYQRAGQWLDQKRFPQVGHRFDIGGRKLNLYCSGEGQPTVLFESTWGQPGFSWVAIQRDIAKLTRACWYDRAGYGWSDPGPFPNHSDSIARDLHKLLRTAGIPGPYVLVGHFMGAFHVRVYRGFYPREVAGMVLVEPMNEDVTIGIHNHNESFRPAIIALFQTAGWFGWWRLLAPDPGPPPRGLTVREWATIQALTWQAQSVPTQTKEPPLWVSGELARHSGRFGTLPVTVLSAGRPGPWAEDRALALELHRRLANASARGQLIVVPNSGPMIPYQAPEAVIGAVRDMIEVVRQTGTDTDFQASRDATYAPSPIITTPVVRRHNGN